MTDVADVHVRVRAWNPLGAFALVLGVFVAASVAARAVPHSMTLRHPWAAQAAQQGLMTIVALAAMAVSGRSFAEFGFRRPRRAGGHFVWWGLALGAASTAVVLAFGLPGLRSRLGAYGAAALVFWIWLVSSTVEEIFCRGWFQSLVAGADDGDGRAARGAVIWSAAVFGTMHLSLLVAGVDIGSVAVIVLFVTALGYLCATVRARSGSLLPAIAAHVAFNIGGFIAGAIYAIGYRVMIGQLPSA
jgi:membrane protease YdiL (CAAX protease family)